MRASSILACSGPRPPAVVSGALALVLALLLPSALGTAPATRAAAPAAAAPTAAAAPAPRDLLLDGQVRQRFVARWSGAFLRVRYHAPLRDGEDPDMRPWRYALAALVSPPPGAPKTPGPAVVAATAWLLGAQDVSLDLGGGRRLPAAVRPPAGDPREVPLVLLAPADPKPLASRPVLHWMRADALREGLRLWAIEWPVPTSSPDDLAAPVLVDTALGAQVEHPLERFWYVPVDHAAGLALVGPDGAVACLVFRAVPGTKGLSLCAPAAAALVGAPAAQDPDAPAGVDVRVERARVQTGRMGH